jgi:multiple antibiotic resistance protein
VKNFVLAFVPIFMAVNAFGLLPLFVGLTEGMTASERRRAIGQSVLTAVGVAVVFVFLGKSLFAAMGIMVEDFMIAGGAVLFLIAAHDVLATTELAHRVVEPGVGAVPLGTPLIVGPAVLTTSLILVDVYGYGPTLVSILVNVGIAGVLLWVAEPLTRRLGAAGTKVVTKVSSLILAAIAVMLIRRGILDVVWAAVASARRAP